MHLHTQCKVKKNGKNSGMDLRVCTTSMDGLSICNLGTSHSRGLTILFNRNFKYEYDVVSCENDGRLIVLDLKILEQRFRLINMYAPNEGEKRKLFF